MDWTSPSAALPLAAGACALAYLALTARPSGLVRSVTKTAAVALLALAVLLQGGPLLLALGLAACALGDLMLSRDGDGPFMAGIAAFALGHLAYVALFLTLPGSDLAALLSGPRLLLAALLLGLGAVAAWALAPRAGALRGPVLIYIPIILMMGLAALTVPPLAGLALVLPAALAFVLSDLVLAAEVFVLAPGSSLRRLTPYVIWVFYWGAQAGFFAAWA